MFLGRVRIPPITGLKDRLRQQVCFLVESEFYRLRFCCNPSSVRERPRQQLCFSLRESTLKRTPVLNLTDVTRRWCRREPANETQKKSCFAAFCSFGELHAFVNAFQTPEKLPKKISKRQPLFCAGKLN